MTPVGCHRPSTDARSRSGQDFVISSAFLERTQVRGWSKMQTTPSFAALSLSLVVDPRPEVGAETRAMKEAARQLEERRKVELERRNDAWKAEYDRLMEKCKRAVADARTLLAASKAKWEEVKPYLRQTDVMSAQDRASTESQKDFLANSLQLSINQMGPTLDALSVTLSQETASNPDQELVPLKTAMLNALNPILTVVEKLRNDAWEFQMSINELRFRILPDEVEFASAA